MSTHHRPFGLMHELLESQSLQASSTAAAGTVRARLIRWCLLDVLQRCESHRDCRSCPLWDDCHGLAKTACDGFVPIDDAIALKRRVSADCWNAEMLCRKPAVQGCVFPAFDPEVHVREPLEQTHTEAGDRRPTPALPVNIAGSTLHLAIDFGFANPFVCLWVRVTGSGPEAIVHVIDEYVQAGQTLDVHLQQIQARKHGAVAWVACDPAGSGPNDQTAASNVALLRRAGYRVRYRTSRIVDGLELIRAALRPASGTPRLYIHPRCTRLIAALRSYRYPQYGNSGARGELPLKDGVHDHLIDALRYLLINRGERKIIVSRY
ncbi:MAG: hypothetical protein NZ561_11005 [Phycisphaerae bacterium]|nr:hypothetical protein [Phycisphaerae bacterium]MDW8262913.1 hypothetical protein [Phycisphaerales bacterium]